MVMNGYFTPRKVEEPNTLTNRDCRILGSLALEWLKTMCHE
jgi:hypothetical protein